MRLARNPLTGSGTARSLYGYVETCQFNDVREVVRTSSEGNGPAKSWFVGLIAMVGVVIGVMPAAAQDPSNQAGPSASASTFPKSSGPIMPSTNINKAAPLYLQGDQLIYDNDGNSVTARGNVEIYYNNYILTADEVVYDQSAGTLTAVGNVELKEPNGSVIRADRYTLTDDFRDGFVQSLSVVATDESRIVARRAVRRDGNTTVFTDGKFTPCKTTDGSQPLWCINAKRVIHDQSEATITYQDAQFEFLGVPLVYLPFFQHADPTVKRKSGFLPPQYSVSDDLGTAVEVPYYFALAPNYDFLFNPLITTKQGVLWKGEFRHRLANGIYNVKLAGIDQDGGELDGRSLATQQNLDGFRGSLETVGLFSLSSWWQAGWDITLESDDSFRRFYNLDSILLDDRVNQVFLRGQSSRNFFEATFYQFGALSPDDSAQSESRVHPIIDYDYVVDQPVLGGELSFTSNTVSFSRRDSRQDGSSSQSINRTNASVKWRDKLIDDIGITYTPFAELRGDVLRFNNVIDPLTNADIDSETVGRGVALGGVTVSYPWIASTANASHTIEPIGQIIGRQASVRQNNLPNEDARSLVFDDTNLFDTDKFSGFDRIETGTRANVGVQYTFQGFNGGHARIIAGQSYHLSGENAFQTPGVDFEGNTASQVSQNGFLYSPNSGLETNDSDYVLGAYLAPFDQFRLISQTRFDQKDFSIEREDATAVAILGLLSASATYTYVAAAPEFGFDASQSEVNGGVRLQLTDHWSVGGSIRYDIDSEFLLTDSFQVQYADDCFALTTTYTETNVRSAEIEPDRSIFVHFEFKHLGDFGYKTDTLFGEQDDPNAG